MLVLDPFTVHPPRGVKLEVRVLRSLKTPRHLSASRARIQKAFAEFLEGCEAGSAQRRALRLQRGIDGMWRRRSEADSAHARALEFRNARYPIRVEWLGRNPEGFAEVRAAKSGKGRVIIELRAETTPA